jgi:hypothetical protein
MLRLLKSNNPANYLLIFIIMAALWAYKFIAMPTAVDGGGMQSYFFRFLYEASLYQYIYTAFAFALAFAFACYASKINFRYQIVESGYQLPSLFFALLTGSIINAQRCIPEMVGTLFLALAVLRIFGMYNKHEDLPRSLDVGLLFGLSIIFAYKYVLLLPALIVIVAIVKPLSWRDLVSMFVSLLFVVGVAFCMVWLYGDWEELLSSVKSEALKLVIGEKYNYLNYLFGLPVLFAVLVSLLSVFVLKVFRKTAEMKYYHSLLFLTAYSGIFMLSPFSSNESVWLMYFPLCYLLSNIIVNSRRIAIQRLVFYGLLICIVVSQILQVMYFDRIF